MCCGCYRFLGIDGQLTKWRRPRRKIPVSVQEWTAALKDADAFETREDADSAAEKAGWQTADDLGPGNHRCPECVKQPHNPDNSDIPVRRGAYISIPGVLAGGAD